MAGRTNEDIAASIIGFIRQAALGDPLIPYADRVERPSGRLQTTTISTMCSGAGSIGSGTR